MKTWRSRAFDIALASVVVAAGLAEILVPLESRDGAGSLTAGVLAVLVAGLALTQRRTFPLPAGLVVLVSIPIIDAFAPTYVLFFGQFVPMAFAVFAMARYGEGRVPFVGAAAGAGTLLYFDLFVPELQDATEVIFHWGVFSVVWAFGYGLSRFERRAQESTRRAIDAEVAAAEQAMAAVVGERTRIARELHDIVAHSVTTMVVQAGAAEQVVEDDPAYVRAALASIRATGSSALADMRRVVEILRDVEQPGSLAPQPGVDALPALVEDTRSAGLAATLEVEGTVRPLPSGIDVAAYRIVQEALTNVRRHARASTVRVGLAYDADALRIEVADDGVGATNPRGGHGLIGMRERATLYGGALVAESPTGSGFTVRAVLPVATP